MFMCTDFSKEDGSNIALTSPLLSSLRLLARFSKRCLNEYLMCSRAVQWIRKCSISSGALWQSGHRSDLFFPAVWDVVSGYLWTSSLAFVDAMRDWSGVPSSLPQSLFICICIQVDLCYGIQTWDSHDCCSHGIDWKDFKMFIALYASDCERKQSWSVTA